MADTFKYKIITSPAIESIEQELDALGRHGWELISAVPLLPTSVDIMCFFVKRITDEKEQSDKS